MDKASAKHGMLEAPDFTLSGAFFGYAFKTKVLCAA